MSHLYGRSPARTRDSFEFQSEPATRSISFEYLPVCIRVCDTQSLRWLNDRLQYWHWYGRSPVWMRRWFFIVLSAVNRSGQYSHAYRRSPVWMRRCFVCTKSIKLNSGDSKRSMWEERSALPLNWTLWIPNRRYHIRMDGLRYGCAGVNSIRLC